MFTPILHHYPMSPFAEKLRLILGFKAMAWQSVVIPVVMPKPDVVALTGGYRKTPILQIGADIYCDTALIARLLERLVPLPMLFPADAPLAPILAQWADGSLFWTMIAYAMQPAGRAALLGNESPDSLKAFATDRAAFTSGMKRQSVADASVNLHGYLLGLEAQLARGGPYLFGERASIADFSVVHNLWFIARAGLSEKALAGLPMLRAWCERMLAIGHGQRSEISSAQAIAVAAAASMRAPVFVQTGLGFEAGEPVTVAAIDYGSDPVMGELVGLAPDGMVLARRDERAGLVHVHFPRSGFQLLKDAKS